MMIADTEERKPNYGRAFLSFCFRNISSWSHDETQSQVVDVCAPSVGGHCNDKWQRAHGQTQE